MVGVHLKEEEEDYCQKFDFMVGWSYMTVSCRFGLGNFYAGKMFSTISIRSFSTKLNILQAISKNASGGINLVEKVAVTDDGKLFVAWHPDVEFPYEFSKPLPTTSEVESTSLIKDTALSSAMRAFKSKQPEIARQELMNLTHTTKHRWYPRSRDKRAKKTPMDRPYL